MREIRARASALSGASAVVWALVALACEGGVAPGQEADTGAPAPAVDGGASGSDDGALGDGGEAPGDEDGGSAPEGDAGAGEEAGPGEADAGAARADAGPDERDAGERPEGLVPVFVAQGYAGRTAVSCDDGRTWIADRSLDDSLRCFTGGLDCDHHPGRAKGLVYSGGWFVGTYGWGAPGMVQRSRDGIAWETTQTGSSYGGIAAEGERVMLGARSVRVSEDEGATWSAAIESRLSGWNVRRAGAAPGRFVLVGDAGDVTLSSDGGRTWWRPRTLPAGCGQSIQNEGGIATIGDAIVMIGGNGSVCRSTDGGETWSAHSVGGAVSSADVVSTGGELMVWGGGRVYRSRDGASWTSAAVSPGGVAIGAVARSADGTFVAVNGGWDQWYERQRFYRSEDGVTWTELPAGSYRRGHPVFQIEAGWAPEEACLR